MNFTEILEATLKFDLREEAEKQLNLLCTQSFPQYIELLCRELCNENNATHIRQASGISLKNTVSSRDPTTRKTMIERWRSTEVEIRNSIKSRLLESLGTSDIRAAQTVGQVIQAIAEIELADRQWDDLVPIILSKSSVESKPEVRISSLKTLGLICETCSCDRLLQFSNPILTCVVSAVTNETANNQIKQAGLTAFYNSLEFICGNFYVDQERNFIMSMVCDAILSEDSAIRLLAYECLVKIVTYYYPLMGQYMDDALLPITIAGMKLEDPNVVTQAIEFWSTICEKEAGVVIEDTAETLNYSGNQNQNFSVRAADKLVEALWPLMKRTDEDEDDEEWNVPTAASTCLSLLALSANDIIVPPISRYIQQNVNSVDWSLSEASVMALGSILNGPNPNLLVKLVMESLPLLIERLNNGNTIVKDTTSWTLGRIVENMPFSVYSGVLSELVQAILKGLDDSPKVASNCAWCLMCLVDHLDVYGNEEGHSVLSQFFEPCVSKLMYVGAHINLNPNVRASSFEAISSFVLKAPDDCKDIVFKLLCTIIEEMYSIITNHGLPKSKDEDHFQSDYLRNLCAVLTSIVRRLEKDVLPILDKFFEILVYIINNSGEYSAVKEDAFLTIGTIISNLEPDNMYYLNPLMDTVISCLKNVQETQLCIICMGFVGDMCRAFEEKMVPLCDNIMNVLVYNLQDPYLNRDIIPPTFSVFGDLALAIGSNFAKYVGIVMNLIFHQSQTLFSDSHISPKDYEYFNDLRTSIIDAYTGIIQGLKSKDSVLLSDSQVSEIFNYAQYISQYQYKDSKPVVEIIGLMGDLADFLPANGKYKSAFSQDWLRKLLNIDISSENIDPESQKIIKWTINRINSHCNIP